jgi:hypothetical protein
MSQFCYPDLRSYYTGFGGKERRTIAVPAHISLHVALPSHFLKLALVGCLDGSKLHGIEIMQFRFAN